MSDVPYLLRLADRLALGLSEMLPTRRSRHRQYVLSQQTDDGGFPGREGGADLYYTGFAVRTLALLGGMDEEICRRLGRFLRRCEPESLSIIDLTSWLYSAVVLQASGGEDLLADAAADWSDRIVARLEQVRTADGGYGKTEEGTAGSTYHSFLVVLTYELLGRKVPKPNRLIQFLYDRQREDGGFVEIAPMKRSGTNPTAAAVAILRMYDALDDEIREGIRGFLKQVRSGEGGFQANTRIPFADGLSTFTGLLTAQDLGLDDILAPEQIEAFVTDQESGLELPTGGFRGASWDQQGDLEYTFYGLGTLALLSRNNSRA